MAEWLEHSLSGLRLTVRARIEAGLKIYSSPGSTAFTLDTERVPGESQVGRCDINHITRRVLFGVQFLTVRTKLPKHMKVWAGSLILL